MIPSPTTIRLSKTPVASAAFVFPVVVFFVLTVLGCQPLLSAGIALLLCIVGPNLVYTGQEMDLIRMMQRTYYTVIGQDFGNWEPLPPIAGVTLKYFSSIAKNEAPSSRASWGIWNDTHKRTEEIIVMLSVGKSSSGITLQTFPLDKLQAAQEFAQDLADQLRVPLHTFLPPHLPIQKRRPSLEERS